MKKYFNLGATLLMFFFFFATASCQKDTLLIPDNIPLTQIRQNQQIYGTGAVTKIIRVRVIASPLIYGGNSWGMVNGTAADNYRLGNCTVQYFLDNMMVTVDIPTSFSKEEAIRRFGIPGAGWVLRLPVLMSAEAEVPVRGQPILQLK